MLNFLYSIFIYPIELLIESVYYIFLNISNNYGISIILLSITVSSLILPLYNFAENQQQKEREKQKSLKHKKDNINSCFNGDKRYMMLSTLYRQNNYHPIYALRSSLGLMIQVPFFIAAFRFLSNLDILNEQSFLFIQNLGKNDGLLGGINILPVIMTLINIISGAVYTKDFSKSDKIQVYALAALFLILLYNSPAALVLYWTCNNIYNLIKNIIYKKLNSEKIINIIVLITGCTLIILSLFFYKGLFLNRILNVFIVALIITIPVWKRFLNYLRNKFNTFMSLDSTKSANIILNIIAILPPNIFLFYLLIRHVEYVYYTHFLILAASFSIISFLMHFVTSRIIKSVYASSLLCVFFWIVFFTIRSLHRNYKIISFLNKNTMLLTIALLLIIITSLIIIYGRRLKNISFYKMFTILLAIIFSINFIQATTVYIQGKYISDLNTDYKTSFFVDTNTQSPNIFWIHTDNMLGFKVMEQYFDDPQIEFRKQLIERDFIVNFDTELVSGTTSRGVPALMSPYFYDTVMLPVLQSNPPDYSRKMESFFPGISHIVLFQARLNNELVNAFNAKNYNTNIIGNINLYFMPISKTFYFKNNKTDYDTENINKIIKFDKLHNIIWLLYDTTPVYALKKHLDKYLNSYLENNVNTKPVKESNKDKTQIYGELYKGNDTWHIDALSEIFEGPYPRMTIIVDIKTHLPLILSEDGSSNPRNDREANDINNYPPQHRYARFYLVNLIDFILENDQDAIIVVQGDHGFGTDNFRSYVLSSGGTPEEAKLISTQVMSAVRIPEKWGGLEEPLDPLNITRELVNRYVGKNYELISK